MREANNLQSIPCSQLWAIANKAITMQEEGHDVIRLELGRPDFDTPIHIKEAAKQALDDGFVHYVSHFGISQLREAIADMWQQDTGHSIDPNENILVTAGGTEGLYLSYAAFLNPGDEILIGDPGWVTYFNSPTLLGVKITRFPLVQDGTFGLDIDCIRSLITPRTRMLLLNSPSNPVGGVFSRAELYAVAELAQQHDLTIVADEVYYKLLFTDAEHISPATFHGMFDRVVTVNSFSKTYSMTGWRLGYVIAAQDRIDAMLRVHQQLGATCCSFGQYGAVAALRGPQNCVADMRAAYQRRMQLVCTHLEGAAKLRCVQPQGGLYVYIDVSASGLDGTQFAMRLLDQEKVALMPGIAFGETGAKHVRLSIADSEAHLQEAMTRMARFMSSL